MQKNSETIEKFLSYICNESNIKPNRQTWQKLSKQFTLPDGNLLTKHDVVEYIKTSHSFYEDRIPSWFTKLLTMKPTRSTSGVTPITIFTKPYTCSGKCIYCPTIENVPKSYLPDEPATQRAIMQEYSPYKQIIRRIESFETNGHNTDKIELIISGGTWDDYPIEYRIWFISEVFRALNELESVEELPQDEIVRKKSLRDLPEYSEIDSFVESYESYQIDTLQVMNESAKHKCVGLSIETRPDKINFKTVMEYRALGITKVQLGIQSLNDDVLKANLRGHNAHTSINAVNLLRLNGFKIMAHWMPNLYGSNPSMDFNDFSKLMNSVDGIVPDELKIYPCSIINGSLLEKLYEKGKFKPYSEDELVELLIKCKSIIPKYSRISRLIRDIPSNDIVAGNKKTNLREVVQSKMKDQGMKCNCIRCREIKNDYDPINLDVKESFEIIEYDTAVTKEYFISIINQKDRILGFVRLSLPKTSSIVDAEVIKTDSSIKLRDDKSSRLFEVDYAMIRELHVYGQSTNIGTQIAHSSQHKGLGKKLMKKAELIAKDNGFSKLAVISAIGTREYYYKLGYHRITELLDSHSAVNELITIAKSSYTVKEI